MSGRQEGSGPSRKRQGRRHDARLATLVHGAASQIELQSLSHRVDAVVDARGTFCPEPVIRLQERMGRLEASETLLLLADDAGVEVDVPAWCMSTGNVYLGIIKAPSSYSVLVRKV